MGDHLSVHRYLGLEPGPRFLVLGAVHGNEVAGTKAIRRLIEELDSEKLSITKGQLSLVPVTNTLAYEQGTRGGERNLNRNLSPKASPKDFEDRLANSLCPLLAEQDVLLDLHSFQSRGEPFALMGPEDNTGELEPFAHAAEEERMVAHLGPRRIVEGWMQVYHLGTSRRRERNPNAAADLIDAAYGVGTTEYTRSQGGYAITFECGQHEDPEAPARGLFAIKQTLALLGMIEGSPEPPRRDHELLKMVDVVDRDSMNDRFVKDWKSFDVVSAGETIGVRADGTEARAPEDGFVVFPNQKAAVGHEWFYFARPSERRLRF